MSDEKTAALTRPVLEEFSGSRDEVLRQILDADSHHVAVVKDALKAARIGNQIPLDASSAPVAFPTARQEILARILKAEANYPGILARAQDQLRQLHAAW